MAALNTAQTVTVGTRTEYRTGAVSLACRILFQQVT